MRDIVHIVGEFQILGIEANHVRASMWQEMQAQGGEFNHVEMFAYYRVYKNNVGNAGIMWGMKESHMEDVGINWGMQAQGGGFNHVKMLDILWGSRHNVGDA